MSVTERNLTISVAAGKGGTGKTLISCSLAEALAVEYPGGVQVLDCDVEEPNCAILLHPEIDKREDVNILVPEVDMSKCIHCAKCAHVCEVGAIAAIGKAVLTFHDMCSGCGACSFVCPTGAISEIPLPIGELAHGVAAIADAPGIDFYEGRLDVGHQRATPVTNATKAVMSPDTITIVDAPPGTACPMQEAVADTNYCILVTEPTPFGLANLREAVATCRRMEIPCGVVINRDRDTDEEMAQYLEEEELDVLLRIPERRSIAEAYSRGETLLATQPGESDEWREALLNMFKNVAEAVANEPATTPA